MKIGVIIYQNLTLLDLVGFTDAMHRLKTMHFLDDLSITYCGTSESCSDNYGFNLEADQIKPDLAVFDLIFIPGGFGTRDLIHDIDFIRWIQTARQVPLKASVCTGSLILGAAGFLDHKKATTHFDEYELLHQYTREVIEADIVEHEQIITGGAVATSIILGLHLCQKLAGREAAAQIAKRMGLPDIYQNANVQVY